jgi:hypothetical protein
VGTDPFGKRFRETSPDYSGGLGKSSEKRLTIEFAAMDCQSERGTGEEKPADSGGLDSGNRQIGTRTALRRFCGDFVKSPDRLYDRFPV